MKKIKIFMDKIIQKIIENIMKKLHKLLPAGF